MKKYKNVLIILIFITLFFELLLNKQLVFSTINYSLHIWINTLLPTLFPFFVVSDILINFNLINYIPKSIKIFFAKLFNVKEDTIVIFFLSLLSGFPSNARNTRILFDKKIISLEEANHILIFTHFSNPLFVLSVTTIFLNNNKLGWLLLTSHYLSNITIGILIRKHSTITNKNTNIINSKSQNFTTVLIKSIKNSIDSILLILGTLTCFLILSSLILNKINLNDFLKTLLNGFLEITIGLKSISLLKIKEIYKVILTSAFLGFGGLSVHMQVIAQIADTKIKYKPFFIGRIFQAIFASIISYIFYIIFI